MLIFRSGSYADVLVSKGGKPAPADFLVHYRRLARGARIRTPKHIHLIVDLFAKRIANANQTEQLVRNHLKFIRDSYPAARFPPVDPERFHVRVQREAAGFAALDGIGEFPVDFLIGVLMLVQIQEKTNYPAGTVSEELYNDFLAGDDIFSLVGTATWRGPGF